MARYLNPDWSLGFMPKEIIQRNAHECLDGSFRWYKMQDIRKTLYETTSVLKRSTMEIMQNIIPPISLQ